MSVRSSARKGTRRAEPWQCAVGARVPKEPLDYRVTIREMLAERNSEQLRPKDGLDRTTLGSLPSGWRIISSQCFSNSRSQSPEGGDPGASWLAHLSTDGPRTRLHIVHGLSATRYLRSRAVGTASEMRSTAAAN